RAPLRRRRQLHVGRSGKSLLHSAPTLTMSTDLRPATSMVELSVVIPICDEADTLPVLVGRLSSTLVSLGGPYEIIFVDDGARDGSSEQLRAIAARDQPVTVIELTRNFGHQIAICAGLDESRGAAVAVMDGDLQDPPEVLPLFLAKLREGHDVVYAVREQ